jgi:outer membrane autotransporter protein
VQLTPFVAIQPTQIIQNGANEYFAGYGAGFYYGANTNTSLPIFIGAEVSGDIDMGNNSNLKPYLRVSWVTDTASSQAMSSSYSPVNGPSIYANGTPSFGNALILKGGAKYTVSDKVSAYATFDIEQGNKTYNYRGIGGSIGVQYRW